MPSTPRSIVPVRESPRRRHARIDEALRREEALDGRRVVVRQVGAHPLAVGRRRGVEVDDHERAAGPQHPLRLGQPRLAARAEEVRGAGVHEVDATRRGSGSARRAAPSTRDAASPIRACAPLHQRRRAARRRAPSAALGEEAAGGSRRRSRRRATSRAGPRRRPRAAPAQIAPSASCARVLLLVDLGPVPDVGAGDRLERARGESRTQERRC